MSDTIKKQLKKRGKRKHGNFRSCLQVFCTQHTRSTLTCISDAGSAVKSVTNTDAELATSQVSCYISFGRVG